MKGKLIILLGAISIAVPAAAAPDAEAGSNSAKKPRKICKVNDATGSRTAWVKVCKTAAQWRQDRERQKDADGSLFMNEAGLNPDPR